MKYSVLIILIILKCFYCFSQAPKTVKTTRPVSASNSNKVLPAANDLSKYVPLIKSKKVAIFANNTAMLGNIHLVDTLQKLGINIVKIFGPEHGFRGTADAGEQVGTYTDEKTGIPVISLYGKKRKPSAEDVADVDVLVFDIQDVGVRFYTYISSLQYYIEAAIENNKPLIILDRPNPNGFYVDGPVLDTAFKSFIGMQPIPVVYGMTIGEYAKFLTGEKLIDPVVIKKWQAKNSDNNARMDANITVIKCLNYTHKSKYILPVKPSPNLPGAGSVYRYPSTCFFEGTALNEGRGTDEPFQIFGHPSLPKSMYAFTPVSREGVKTPKLQNQRCYGWNISGTDEEILKEINGHIQIKYLLEAYKLFPGKDTFFIAPKKANPKPTEFFFNKLAGNAILMQQIKEGKSEGEIRASWQPGLEHFKKVRKKYLLYEDF